MKTISAIRTGIRISTTHAPSANLDAATSTATTAVVTAPRPLTMARRIQPCSSARSRHQWRTMPDWLSVKAMKTPTVYSGISAVTLPPKATISSADTIGEHDDAAGEGQPLAAELERARQEAVLGQDARQAREVGERRVRGEHEQHGRRDLDEVVEGRARADERPRDLAHHGLLLGWVREDAELRGEEAQAQEDQRKGRAHEHQHAAGVARLRLLERGNAVRDGLRAGQRDGPRRECAQDEQDAQRLGGLELPARRAPCRSASCSSRSGTGRSPGRRTSRRGRCTSGALKMIPLSRMPRRLTAAMRMTSATPIDDARIEQLGHDRGQRGDAGGDRHGNGQDVVGQQSRGRGQAGERAQVVGRDDVRATAVRIGADRLPIADHDDREDDDDRDRDRHRQRQRTGAGQRQDAHDLFARVGGRRDVVRGEHRQPGDDAQPLLGLLVRRERPAEHGSPRSRERAR